MPLKCEMASHCLINGGCSSFKVLGKRSLPSLMFIGYACIDSEFLVCICGMWVWCNHRNRMPWSLWFSGTWKIREASISLIWPCRTSRS